MMRVPVQVAILDQRYSSNLSFPFVAALMAHAYLFYMNPILLKSSPNIAVVKPIDVKYMETLPNVAMPKPPEPVKKVEKKPEPPKPVEKPAKKAKKSGLSLSAKAPTIPVRPTKIQNKPVAAKPLLPKIAMPKFTPRDSDMPIAASPMPGMAPASSRRAVSPMSAPAPLKGRSRGVRAQDIPFQLTDRGSASLGGGPVVAIPIGEERDTVASLPSAPIVDGALKSKKGISGYRYKPGDGVGSGELVGKDRGNNRIGYYGVAKADAYVEGELNGSGGSAKGGTVHAGKGFEIGGPVGDRKIMRRKLPEYPAWAEEKGITALVKIYFTVKADGSIRSNMRILTSSGYSELDDLAKQALKEWKFSATSANSDESAAWGVITFRFTLA